LGTGGCIELVRTLRARSTIRAELHAQQHPSARLLASRPHRET
jgi:hypothetical protein